ncbi:MAG: hypothetical protein WC738_04505 [Candidatus Omnitrophota bacterium]|jgi:hypothetical protein
MDMVEYTKYQKKKSAEHEALCKRCGVCCGVGNDPCINLKADVDGKYYCESYDDRLGERLTVLGKKFTCVPIKEVLAYAPPSPDCGYAFNKE